MRILLLGILALACCGQSVDNNVGGGSSGTVTSVQVSGTANQITATSCGPSTTTLACTLSIPSAFQLPGTINGNTITTGTGTLTLGAVTLNAGVGGTLGSNAFTSTSYAPLASPTFTGTVVIPTPFTIGAVSMTSTGTQLNYLSTATGVTGTASVVLSASPTLTGTITAAAANFSGAVQVASLVATSGDVVTSNLIYKNGASVINLGTDGKMIISNNAQNKGWMMDGNTTDGTVSILTRAAGDTAILKVNSLTLSGSAVVLSGLGSASGTPDSVCLNTNTMVRNTALTCTVSSRDFKTNIHSIKFDPSEALMSLDPVEFAYRDHTERLRWGFIAEDVSAVDSRLADGYDARGVARSLDQNAILALTVKMVQQQQYEIDRLRAIVEAQ